MKKLENIDIRILKALLKDGRTNFTDIAKECDTSKDIIWFHFNQMEKAGIIVGSTIQYNFQKFGYTGVATTLLSVESQNLLETYNYVKTIPDIRSILNLYNSPYNIAVITTFKNLSDLEYIKRALCKQGKIGSIRTFLWTDVRNIPENIFVCPDNSENFQTPILNDFQINNQEDLPEYDQIDNKIIEMLTLDGRLPFAKIAGSIATSTTTVVRRYNNLRKNNLIKVSIQFDPVKLGFQSFLEISLTLSDQNKSSYIVDAISKIPGVSYMVKTSGYNDLFAVALVKDCNDAIEINRNILEIPNIKKIEAHLRQITPTWPTVRQYISTF
jgi:Lrp/AsnC family transcriptional regulator for asnA, asnC and gidA